MLVQQGSHSASPAVRSCSAESSAGQASGARFYSFRDSGSGNCGRHCGTMQSAREMQTRIEAVVVVVKDVVAVVVAVAFVDVVGGRRVFVVSVVVGKGWRRMDHISVGEDCCSKLQDPAEEDVPL